MGMGPGMHGSWRLGIVAGAISAMAPRDHHQRCGAQAWLRRMGWWAWGFNCRTPALLLVQATGGLLAHGRAHAHLMCEGGRHRRCASCVLAG
jgi:hypothetical protein